MIHPECQVEGCRRTVPDGAPMCTHHASELAERLRSVPDLLDDLLVTISRQDRLGTGGKAGPPDEQPAPRLDVTRALDGVVTTVTTWARHLAQAHKLRVTTADRSAQDTRLQAAALAADWLADHAHLLRAHPHALQAYRALTRAITRARDRADRPADRTRFVVGPCPENDEHGQPCTGQVWAHVPTDERESAELRCHTCGTSWDTTRWNRTGQRIHARRRELT